MAFALCATAAEGNSRLSPLKDNIGQGCPKLGTGSEEVVGHMMDTVHVLTKGELKVISVSGPIKLDFF